jgi:diguanylate cyclase (GGDEF)-like protein
VRDTDVVARWGGEEFVVMLTDTSEYDARDMLERIRTAVAELRVPHGSGSFRLTVSAGLAQHLPGDTVARTLERADQALYSAKAMGRNRIATADAESWQQSTGPVAVGV